MKSYLIAISLVALSFCCHAEVAKPTIFAAEYFNDGGTQVRIVAEEGASIFYTDNGSQPTASSKRYDGMFKITKTCSIRAIAVKEGETSAVATSYPTLYEKESGGMYDEGETFILTDTWNYKDLSLSSDRFVSFKIEFGNEGYSGPWTLLDLNYQLSGPVYDFDSMNWFPTDSKVCNEYRYVLGAGSYTFEWSVNPYFEYGLAKIVDFKSLPLQSWFNVYFDSNGGTSCSSLWVSKGSQTDSLPTPTREPGEDFVGWFDEYGNRIDNAGEILTPYSSIVLQAHWQNIGKIVDPSGTLAFTRSAGGKWSEYNSYPRTARYVSTEVLKAGAECSIFSITVQGASVVRIPIPYSYLCEPRVYVDGQLYERVDSKIEIWSAGQHTVVVKAKSVSSGIAEMRFDAVTATPLPTSTTVTLNANGGACDPASVTYSIGDTFGELPLPIFPGCDFVGWFDEQGEQVKSTDTVSMLCKTLKAKWNATAGFFDPSGTLSVVLCPELRWNVTDGSYATATPISGVWDSTCDTLLEASVTGKGILSFDFNHSACDLMIDGVVATPILKSVQWSPEKGYYESGVRRECLFEITSSGKHEIALVVRRSNYSMQVFPMKWTPVGDRISVSLDPAGGSMLSSECLATVGSTYNLPEPSCDWGSFKGWYYVTAVDYDWEGMYDKRIFVDEQTPVSLVYTNLTAAYSASTAMFDQNDQFDIRLDYDGQWTVNDADQYCEYPSVFGKYALWKSETFNRDEFGDGNKELTVMTFTPKTSGVLNINNLSIDCVCFSGLPSGLPVRAYICKNEPYPVLDGPWLSFCGYEQWDSDSYRREGNSYYICHGRSYAVGKDRIANCEMLVEAGVEYRIFVTIDSDVFTYDYWSGLSELSVSLFVGQFSLKPCVCVRYMSGDHGRTYEQDPCRWFYAGSPFVDYNSGGGYQGRTKDLLVNLPSDSYYELDYYIGQCCQRPGVNPDAGWWFKGWSGESTPYHGMSVVAAYEPYLYSPDSVFSGTAFLPAGKWSHSPVVQMYRDYPDQTDYSIAGFKESNDEAEPTPNVRLWANDSSMTWIENEVEGPCKVSFDWMVSSESFHNFQIDYFSFSVDGVEKDWIGGEVGWTSREIEVKGFGKHTLRWSYIKDDSGADGEDCGRVANITIAPLVEIAFQASGQEEYGNPPSSFWLYEGESAPLPGAASLVWPCHELTGWSDGKKTYAVGENYLAGDMGISLVAVWSEKRQSAPVIQVPEKFEAKEAQVVMTADAGSTIHYTLDGSEPDESSTCYDGPFFVDCSCIIKAIAIRADWFDSEVVSASTVKAVYTVTFSPGLHGKLSGGVSAQQSVLHGEAAVAPTVIAADWYSFIGWDSAFDCVTADMTVTAMYGLAPRSVEDVECYADIGLSGKNVGAYLDVESRDGCMILLDAADSSVEMKVTGYCRVSCQVRPNVCAIDGAIRIKVDGELYSVVREAGLAVVELNGEGLHAVQWSGLGEVGDFEITDACLISFAGEFGEKGKFPDPIPLYEGDACYLPYPDGVTYDKHTFKCWRYGSNMWFAGDEIVADVNSMAFYAVWDENRLNDPIILADDYFEGETMNVEIASDEFAEVHYTTDGSVPSDSSPIYTGIFTVNSSCVIKAIAVRENWYASGVSVKQITRGPWTFGEYLGVPGMTFATDGDAEWLRAKGEGPQGSYALKSGHIDNSQSSYLRTTLTGAGVIRFSYRVSSEAYKQFIDDGLVVYLDGVANLGMFGGNTGWQTAEIHVPSGEHVITWSYEKSASDERDVGSDCAWLAKVEWLPDALIPSVENLREVFGESSTVAQAITDSDGLAAFNKFLTDCGVISTLALTPSQKQYAYQSFKLSDVTTAPQLFEEEPVLKIDDIELTGGNLSLMISLAAGAEAIQLAKDKLAEKIRVGSTIGDITGKPTIVASPAADGTSLIFTITPPEGNQGFVKVVID